jgi:hypothetical protein
VAFICFSGRDVSGIGDELNASIVRTIRQVMTLNSLSWKNIMEKVLQNIANTWLFLWKKNTVKVKRVAMSAY